MADLKRAAEEAAAKAVVAAGKDAAKQAARELLSPAGQDAEAGKKRRTKIIVMAVLGLCVLVGVVGVALSYWHWFLLIGMLGLGGLYARWRWQRRRAAKLEAPAKLEAAEPRAAEARVAKRVQAVERDPEAEARARAEAAAADEAAVEDELAAMKARLKR